MTFEDNQKSNKRMKHDYTNEIELKSLLIREKNKRSNTGKNLNDEINDLIEKYKISKDKELANLIIEKSEKCIIDDNSHNIFGNIILLMIKKVLTKPNFSGYSWVDEFYSDGCYRVFKYLHNFDHTKTSSINEQPVSAFAYISQIIHNSILSIIVSKNKISEENEKLIKVYNEMHEISNESENTSKFLNEKRRKVKTIDLDIKTTFYDAISNIDFNKDIIYDINYENYSISYDEYAKIQELIKNKKCIINIIKIKGNKNDCKSRM